MLDIWLGVIFLAVSCILLVWIASGHLGDH